MKLIIGMRSYHSIFVPQEKHFDLPFIKESPVLNLRTKTLRKLPMIEPKIKKII